MLAKPCLRFNHLQIETDVHLLTRSVVTHAAYATAVP